MPIILIIILFISPCALADEPFLLDKIIVTPHEDFFSNESMGDKIIETGGFNSPVDLFRKFSGLDLRYRGTYGIQGDLSIRGSTYEQVAVLIDGLNIMDPQTGHHNLDIPLTIFDIDSIAVFKEGVSSLYGAGALGGAINIRTKKPTEKILNLEATFGGHALFSQAFSYSMPNKDLSSRISLEHNISSGARPNTDFEYGTSTFYLTKDFDQAEGDFLFGYQKKNFGADSFYSNLFPEEEEHTETVFIKTGLNTNSNNSTFKNNLYLRRHRDRFILRRNNPTSINHHLSYIYGFNSQMNLTAKHADLLLGLDAGQDKIRSTNLGKHERFHNAVSFGVSSKNSEKFFVEFRLRPEYYEDFSWQFPYNLGLGYYLISNTLRLKGALSEAYRVPSFTDLYYFDAANKGNPGLGVEKSDNFRLGLDFNKDILFLSLEGFLRKGRNLIDWTRTSPSDPWQATNLGRVDFTGAEFTAKLRPRLIILGQRLNELSLSYTYTKADKKASGFFSKYALDILKHQLIFDVDEDILGLDWNWQLSYKERYYGEIYFVGDLAVSKKLIRKNLIVEPFIRIENFTNAQYSEIGGVSGPGRWLKAGIKLQW
ncbi:MAG: TonB-dependent receptor [Candidatus Omnitrophota bacterium]